MDEDRSSSLQKCVKMQENVESQLNDREKAGKMRVRKCVRSADEMSFSA